MKQGFFANSDMQSAKSVCYLVEPKCKKLVEIKLV